MNSRALIFLLMAFLAAATLLFIGTEDAEVWLQWTDNVSQHGLIDGYRLSEHEHPPLLSLLFLASAKLGALMGLHTYYGLKLGLLLFLVCSTAIIYYWSSRNIEFTFYCYLSLLLSSLSLAYIDIYFAPFVLLAFYFISKGRHIAAVCCFSVAVFIKYPPLIIAPFVAVYLFGTCGPIRKDIPAYLKKVATTMVVPALIVAVPIFTIFGAEPLYALRRAFEHEILSAQALNFNWIITRLIQIFPAMEFSSQGWHAANQYILLDTGWSIVLLRAIVSVFYLSLFASFVTRPKNIESLLLFCIAGHMTYFIFNHGVHENHLFLSCVLAIALACINPRFTSLAITLSAISSLNLIAFYGFGGTKPMMWPIWYQQTCFLNSSSPLNPICALNNAYHPYFDLRLLLAIFNVYYYFRLWIYLVFKRDTSTFV